MALFHFSSPYFPVFSPNTGKYEPEKTPYLETFYAVYVSGNIIVICIHPQRRIQTPAKHHLR